MSKQNESKAAQNYRKTPNCCNNCTHFRKEVVETSYKSWDGLRTLSEDKRLRCGIGGFAVSKMAVCDKFELVAS